MADNWDALIGSYESDAKSIPWQAGLVEIGKSAPFCGATIICHRFVMTAAHCIRPVCINNPGSCYQILIEEHDIATGLDQATRHNVKAINFHPNWFGPGVVFYDYDLALLELTEEVILTGDSRAKAACLPAPSDDYFGNGTTFIVGGWDWQSAGASSVPKYHHGTVPAMSDKECKQIYGETNTPRLHCVGHVNKGNVSCKADIGGKGTFMNYVCKFFGFFTPSPLQFAYCLMFELTMPP